MNDQHMQGAGYAAQADFLHKVWTDDAFAARLEGDPKAVFAEMGSQIPDDLEIRVVRDTDNVKHLHIRRRLRRVRSPTVTWLEPRAVRRSVVHLPWRLRLRSRRSCFVSSV